MINVTKFLALLSLVNSINVFATSENHSIFINENDTPKNCNVTGIKEIKVPLDHFDPDSKIMMSYFFQHIEVDRNVPTILLIPGGPGQDFIGNDILSRAAANFNRIMIDPRGIGCNFPNAEIELHYRSQHLTTKQYVQDLIEVVKSLGDQKIIIHGVSYGTVVATMLAYELEQRNIRPQSIILEGTFGLFGNDGAFYQNQVKELENIIKNNPSILEVIGSNEITQYVPHEKIISLIRNLLVLGPKAVINMISKFVAPIANVNDETRNKYLLTIDQLSQNNTKIGSRGSQTFYCHIAPFELFHNEMIAFKDIVDGQIVSESTTMYKDCVDFALVNQSDYYDLRDYPIESPIYYFQGVNDALTPIELARKHLDFQLVKANKEWIDVKLAGHTPLLFNLSMCNQEIFKLISENKSVKAYLSEDNNCK